MEIQSKDELHRLSSFNFWCHNKGDEKSCSGMFKREILDTKLLRHGTNDLQSEKSTTKIASNITNMALSAENKKKHYLLFRTNSQTEYYDRKGKEINVI